jgi:hypothetical protein
MRHESIVTRIADSFSPEMAETINRLLDIQPGETVSALQKISRDGVPPESFLCRFVSSLKHAFWLKVDDKEHDYLLVPILVLAHEHDPDPEMRPLKCNIDVERREKLILGIATGVTAIYRYFAPQRRRMQARFAAEGTAYRQAERKIGRNDL